MAWLVDSLREEGREHELAVILGNANILSLSSSAVGGFVGGLIAEHSLELPFAVGACSAFSASLLALYWTRGRDEIFESRKRRYREFLKKGAYVIIKSKPLVLLTVGSFFIALSIPNFTLTWAPYMEDLGASEWLLGLASSVFMATMGLGSYIGGRLVKRLNYKNTVVLALSSMSLAFLALTFVKIHIFS